MFRRRRRKPRVVWLKQPGTPYSTVALSGGAPAPYQNPAALEISAQSTIDNTPVTIAAPLVLDQSPEETFVGASLSVLDGVGLNQTIEFGYRLRRIVGDIFIAVASSNEQSVAAGGLLVQAGIIVRREDPNNAGQPSASAPEQDVGSIGNESDPWVWRKNWVFSNGIGGQANLVHSAIQNFPAENTGYGSATHTKIDQKTARRLGPEERLFFNITLWTIPLDKAPLGDNTNNFQLYMVMPYRVLGTVLTNSGNRRNATR